MFCISGKKKRTEESNCGDARRRGRGGVGGAGVGDGKDEEVGGRAMEGRYTKHEPSDLDE